MKRQVYLFFYSDNEKPFGLHRVTVGEGKMLANQHLFRPSTQLQVREWRISPDGRQVVIRIFRDLILVNLYPIQEPEWRWLYRNDVIYPSLWSPNGQYLLVSTDPRFQDLLLLNIATNKIVSLIKVPESEWVGDSTSPHQADFVYHGWYPDSRAVWYVWQRHDTRKGTPILFWYKRPIPSGRITRLSSVEVRRIQSDWDFVRWGIMPPGTPFAYSNLSYTADGNLRIQRIPMGESYPPTFRFRLQHRGKGWRDIPDCDEILDVSADKLELLRMRIGKGNKSKIFYIQNLGNLTKTILYECSEKDFWYRQVLIAGRFEQSSYLV